MLRPIREQVDHDRVIRQLQARWRRRYAVGVNVGVSQETTIRIAGQDVHPDLVLTTTEGGRRLYAVVEVETTESVNQLEAMAQWARFAKARAAFFLYVPAGMAEVAQRLCHSKGIRVTEIWTYYSVGDQVRFSMAHRSDAAKRAAAKRKAAGGSVRKGTKAAKKAKKKVAKKKTAKKKVVKKKAVKKKVAKKKVAKKKAARKNVAKKKVVKKAAKKKAPAKKSRRRS